MPKVGNREISERDVDGRSFNDGKPLAYGLGLFVKEYRGVHNVYHSGSTAGYRAHLNRFPETRTSVAVLCNGSNGDASRAANRVSDVFLVDRLKPDAASPAAAAGGRAQSAAIGRSTTRARGQLLERRSRNDVDRRGRSGALVLRRRPDTVIKLTAIGRGQFRGSIGTVTFTSKYIRRRGRVERQPGSRLGSRFTRK